MTAVMAVILAVALPVWAVSPVLTLFTMTAKGYPARYGWALGIIPIPFLGLAIALLITRSASTGGPGTRKRHPRDQRWLEAATPTRPPNRHHRRARHEWNGCR